MRQSSLAGDSLRFWSNSRLNDIMACLNVFLTMILVGLVIYGLSERNSLPVNNLNLDLVKIVTDCTNSYSAKLDQEKPNYNSLNNALSLCQDQLKTGLLAREQVVRDDNYVFQHSENIVIMWMVVGITVSGVLLAGLQLLASFRLATHGGLILGRTDGNQLGTETELKIRPDDISVKSSVVGVVILAISFAFFMVYVLYVYTLKEAAPSQSGNSERAQLQTPMLLPPNIGLSGGPLPMLPRQDGPESAPPQMSLSIPPNIDPLGGNPSASQPGAAPPAPAARPSRPQQRPNSEQ